MQELWTLEISNVLQSGHKCFKIVAIDGAHIVQSQLIKQGAGNDHSFHMFFGSLRQLPGMGNSAEHLFTAGAHGQVQAATQNAGEIFGEATHIF